MEVFETALPESHDMLLAPCRKHLGARAGIRHVWWAVGFSAIELCWQSAVFFVSSRNGPVVNRKPQEMAGNFVQQQVPPLELQFMWVRIGMGQWALTPAASCPSSSKAEVSRGGVFLHQ